MKLGYLIGVFIILSRWAFAQHDSTQISVESLYNRSSLQWAKDSITINAWADSLKALMQNKFNPDSLQLKNKIDSLTSLQLSTEPYASRFDSLLASKQSKFYEVGEKKKQLASQTKGKLDQWQQRVRSRLDSLGFKEAIPSATIPELNQLDLPSLRLPELPSLSANDFTALDLSADLSILNKELPFASFDGLQEFQENLSGVTEKLSLVSDMKNNAGQTIETAIGEMDAVKEIQKQTQAFEAVNPLANPTEQLPDADQVKEQAVEKGINHFAGKDEQLSQAMNQISKYKQKYSSVQSLKDLPKKIPDSMKEKPFVEKLIPELVWQVFMKDNFMLDVAPYVGYRFTQRFTVGAGWNQRISFNSDKTSAQTNVYGPRLYGAYKIVKGISARLELETMNAFALETITNTDVGQREWVPAILAGMKQEYKIYKNLKGTAFVLYNFYNPDYKSPYGDRLNMRFGFEYSFIARKR